MNKSKAAAAAATTQKRKSTGSAPGSAPKRLKEMAGKEAHRQFWMEEFGRTPDAWDRHEARRNRGDFDDGGSQDDSDRGSGFDDDALSGEEDSDDSDGGALRKTIALFRSECDEAAADDIRHALRNGDRTFMIYRADFESINSSTTVDALKAALDKYNQAAMPRIKAMAATKPITNPGGGKSVSKEERIAAYKQDLSHIDVSSLMVDLTCKVLRKHIRRVLEAGIMKKGEFCKAIDCSIASLNTFLKDEGESRKSKVQVNAWDWFKQRQIAGLKMPS